MKRFSFWLLLISFFSPIVGLKHAVERRLSTLDDRAPSLYTQSARYQADSLRRYSLGFDFVVADLIWLRLLDKARTKDTESGKVSWEFAQLDAITALDRNFERAYPFGAAFLSVFLRDTLGARLILEKWVRYYPQNWRTHYTLGYHLYFEMGEYKPAAEHILAAAALAGSPSWLSALGIRLLSESGSLANALRMAVSLFPSITDPAGQGRLQERIRSLVYSLQKASWREALTAYRNENHREPESLGSLAGYFQGHARELASVVGIQEVPEELRPLFAETHSFRYDPGEKNIVPVNPEARLEKSGIHHQQ